MSCRSNQLTREQANRLKEDVDKLAATLLGQLMIMDLVMWIQQHACNYTTDTDSSEHSLLKRAGHMDSNEDLDTVLLHVDHMRAKGKYVKTIHKWVDELGLTGRLLFWEKLILIILQGSPIAIKVCGLCCPWQLLCLSNGQIKYRTMELHECWFCLKTEPSPAELRILVFIAK